MKENNRGTVVVIGAGIAGLASAYYLVRDGWDVKILEKNTLDNNCSYGNAGMIVPSHFTPLAAPGIVAQGIKWMFNSKSPFYVRPSLNPRLINWGLKFLKHANRTHVEQHASAIRDLNLYSSRLYDELAQEDNFDFELKQNGILMMYKSKEMQHEEIELAHRAQDLGLDVDILEGNTVQELEPNLKLDVLGAILYRCDGKLYPPKLMQQLIQYLKAAGVAFFEETEVHKFMTAGNKIKEAISNKGSFQADAFVLTGGAYLPQLTSKLHLNTPLMPGKGYSFMYQPQGEQTLNHAALLLEARVAVTPMNGQIRFSGTMELGPANDRIYENRVRGIVESIPKYYPELKVDYPSEKIWYGYRPCSPDGLPYLGRLKKFDNAIVAGGGGMMGLSLGPAYGKVVADLLAGQKIESEIAGFRPDRFD
ncbi:MULTISPECIES: NAD(P)/FAD-dependent oxidoreductase [Sphingobacterium]|uniref:Glycine oxidase n=1 Tax=Sphingobacterium multivorum TaxID=28454 RepID=A0A654D4Z4_SPHMU|nr:MULTISPECIES: FAD-dependent oxidoreductase [Sphingobacterium]QQT45081.1 FAD-dependent oxidoreductase [Sphingobacterium multivorum]QQT62264.1 FAD-dependent oxidoreductase [Sphingobacterium multivorum]SUJ20402.1 Glycine oxidase [Sphingobacterium multivorum]VXD00507.1 Glycine oxidase [Sphingobacterium multivorum]